jgi:hypothetical protein
MKPIMHTKIVCVKDGLGIWGKIAYQEEKGIQLSPRHCLDWAWQKKGGSKQKLVNI